MRTIERIFKKISERPTAKVALEKKVLKGFQPTKRDIQNLKIMLKRMYVDVPKNVTDSQVVRMYLNEKYREEVQLQELSKKKKKEELNSKTKLKRLLQILKEAEVSKEKPTKMGSHFVKLVK